MDSLLRHYKEIVNRIKSKTPDFDEYKFHILVVDEILSVGDYQFQQKCYERMGQMLSGGTTLLYVSHDVNSVRQLCDHAIWIDKGDVKMSGLVEEVTDRYMHMNQ